MHSSAFRMSSILDDRAHTGSCTLLSCGDEKTAGDKRILKPKQVKGLQGSHRPSSLCPGPSHVSLDLGPHVSFHQELLACAGTDSFPPLHVFGKISWETLLLRLTEYTIILTVQEKPNIFMFSFLRKPNLLHIKNLR